MYIYDIVFTNGRHSRDLKFVEVSSDTNSKYKSIYLENTLTQQRYFLSKNLISDIIKARRDNPESGDMYPYFNTNSDILKGRSESTADYSLQVYDIDSFGRYIDQRNFNVVLDRESDKTSDVLSIAIDNDAFQLIDYEDGARIIQTGRRNGYRTCLIDIPNISSTEDEDAAIYAISIILRPRDKEDFLIKYNIFIDSSGNVSVYDYNLAYSDPCKYVNYIDIISNDEEYFKSFKSSDLHGLASNVLLVNTKFIKRDGDKITVPLIDDIDNLNKVKIIPCDTETILTDKKVHELLTTYLISKNVRVLTSLGVKVNSEFYKKYKILYMYAYSTRTGISTCIKSN
jgi:hypothetical protein